MYTPIEQNVIDQKIHSFMAKKSPARTFSRTLAARLTPSFKTRKNSSSDITYEATEWRQSTIALHTSFQKAR